MLQYKKMLGQSFAMFSAKFHLIYIVFWFEMFKFYIWLLFLKT